jgi:hypothetical protein
VSDREDDERYAKARVCELREEGKQVSSIGWSASDEDKTIEHEASPEPSNKD